MGGPRIAVVLAPALFAACGSFGTSGTNPSPDPDAGEASSSSSSGSTPLDAGVFTCEGATYCDDFERMNPDPTSPLIQFHRHDAFRVDLQ